MDVKHYYNPNGEEILDEKIFGGSPTGFVDFNRSRYRWDSNIYDLMNANTWFPSEVNTSSEKKNFDKLTDNEQSIYKMTFAQLSFNDSAQEEFLSDFRRLANKIQTSTIDAAYTMIEDAVNIELEYGKYLLDQFPIMGVTPELMEQTVYNYANDRLRKIGLNPIFEESNTTYLQKLVTKHLEMNEVKSNFFESNVSNYAKSSIDLNDF